MLKMFLIFQDRTKIPENIKFSRFFPGIYTLFDKHIVSFKMLFKGIQKIITFTPISYPSI